MVFWLFQTVFLDDMYKMIRKNEIEKAITLVEKNIDSTALQNILYELDQIKEIKVTPTGDFRFVQRIGNDTRDKARMETLTQEQTFTLADGRTVSLTFHAIITPVDATISTLKIQFYIITVIMVLLSIVLALIIAKRVSRPIVEINKSAKILASGDYNTHFAGHGFLEVAELSDTLNTAANELSKVESLRRELMANISHDLRTPLALIYSYAEMMHDFRNEITPEQTKTIMDETTRLTSLVNDVLDLSRLETGTMKLTIQKYDLTKSIGATVSRITELVKKDGYIINFEHEQDIMVMADEVKITGAFYNLLLNAITHSGNDKSITVRQSVNNGKAKIEVVDNGEGIAPEDLPYIWDRYYKVDKKHKRAITGTGLGLSIVKKILDLHGAEYGVESAVGDGSNFWFKLTMDICEVTLS